MGRRRKATRNYGTEKNFNRGQRGPGKDYDLAPRHSELYVKFYQGQNLVPDGEWDQFYETCKKNLPVTFRITGYKRQAEELLANIQGKFFNNLLNQTVDGVEISPPKCLSWYPRKLAWQLDLSRKVVRSSEHFSRLHDFLIAETECGAISRQEAVSMIPPLVMDVQSHHKILDMCASPGSKTAQLIEYLHSTAPPGEIPKGYVIANDTDNKRCYLMVHQVKRLQSPCCMIVNHDGTIFPKILSSKPETTEEKVETEFFDRILCDVPCSGDGTMRKNYDVWTKWHPLQGANMHGLQCKLLRRGCQLLALGGRLVYSTCSLNPAEDEAVIAEILRTYQGALELVDVSNALPGLKYTKGVSHWRVMTKKGEWIDEMGEIPEPLKSQFKSSVFPPTPEEAEEFHLDRCLRILPHQQDTGGFFVAVLQKVRHLPGSKEANMEIKSAKTDNITAEEKQAESETADATAEEKQAECEKGEGLDRESNETGEGASAVGGTKRKIGDHGDQPPKKKKLFGYKEDPFLFMTPNDPVWHQIRDFFGLKDSLPVGQILYRSEQGKRTLYFVSEAIRNITINNDGRIRFINMGVKAFSRSPSPIVPECNFRITQECIGSLMDHVSSKRFINITKNDAITAISEENPFIAKLSESTQAQLNALTPGSTIYMFTPSEKEPSPNCEIVFCGWRGKNSVRCFGSRMERSHALMLLGEDLKDIIKRVEEKKQAKKEAMEESKKKDNGASVTNEGKDDDAPPVETDEANNSEEKREETDGADMETEDSDLRKNEPVSEAGENSATDEVTAS